jgi:hypothetical protein
VGGRFATDQPPGLRYFGSVKVLLGKGLGIDLIDGLELGDFQVDELIAVALVLDLGGLLDPVELLVAGEGRFLSELLAHEADHFRHLLDRQAALLVEEQFEVLAVRARDLEDDRGLAADLLGAG